MYKIKSLPEVGQFYRYQCGKYCVITRLVASQEYIVMCSTGIANQYQICIGAYNTVDELMLANPEYFPDFVEKIQPYYMERIGCGMCRDWYGIMMSNDNECVCMFRRKTDAEDMLKQLNKGIN